jgi:hypothetical protein
VTVFGLARPAAAGGQVPFKGYLEGELTVRTPLTPTSFHDRFDLEGTGTQLGDFELVLEGVVDFGTPPPKAVGTFTFVAANGDTLVAEFLGSSAPVEPGVVLITEHAVITGGTGRFAGAGGSFVCERLFDLVTRETVGFFEGTISVPGK